VAAAVKKWSLTAVADQQLAYARSASNRPSSQTIHGGRQQQLRQTVIALPVGQVVDEPDNLDESTLQVLCGRVQLSAGELTSDGSAGEFLIVPAGGHTVESLDDAVLLLTEIRPPRRMASEPGS
jgi:quercetin dioxygenase-like cupin family protein